MRCFCSCIVRLNSCASPSFSTLSLHDALPISVIEPGAMLMAEKGPIYIGKRAVVMSHAIIRSTSAICEGSVVKMGAKIYEDTTIGPVCKVGGEISNVIFHSYSNKAHDGYAGNSVFGQWCNL